MRNGSRSPATKHSHPQFSPPSRRARDSPGEAGDTSTVWGCSGCARLPCALLREWRGSCPTTRLSVCCACAVVHRHGLPCRARPEALGRSPAAVGQPKPSGGSHGFGHPCARGRVTDLRRLDGRQRFVARGARKRLLHPRWGGSCCCCPSTHEAVSRYASPPSAACRLQAFRARAARRGSPRYQAPR